MMPPKERLDLLGSIFGAMGAGLATLGVVCLFVFGPGSPAGVVVAPRHILLAGIALIVFGCWLKLLAK